MFNLHFLNNEVKFAFFTSVYNQLLMPSKVADTTKKKNINLERMYNQNFYRLGQNN